MKNAKNTFFKWVVSKVYYVLYVYIIVLYLFGKLLVKILETNGKLYTWLTTIIEIFEKKRIVIK